MTAALFALLSAALFAGTALAVRRALQQSTAITITVGSIIINVAATWLLAALTADLGLARQPAAVVLLGAGVLAPALARFAMFTAIGRIGIARTEVAGNTSPIFTALGAAVFLHERITAAMALGTIAVVAGVVITTARPSRSEEGSANRTGVGLALSTALLITVSLLLRKVGLRSIPTPTLAAALTQTGALAALLPLAAVRLRREPVRLSPSALWPILAAGLLSTGGFLAYFVALHLGEVSRVAPLSNTTPLFVVLLLRLFFPRLEAVTERTALGAVLAVAGSVLVVIG